MAKQSVLGEFFSFLRQEKKYWIAPIAVVLVLLGLLLVFAQSSAVAPFIYSLFYASVEIRVRADLHPGNLRVLARLGRVPAARRRDRGGSAGGALHAQEARRVVLPAREALL